MILDWQIVPVDHIVSCSRGDHFVSTVLVDFQKHFELFHHPVFFAIIIVFFLIMKYVCLIA
jgi:hypothetical protein